MTLYTALVTLSKISAPFIPFMTEEIYRNLVCSVDKSAPVSVHLCDFPSADESMIDSELERQMEDVLDVVVLGRSARNNVQIKNRQPLANMYVKADFTLPEYFTDVIADELNVKKVTYTSDVRDFTTYIMKPQLKTIGPKYGKYLGQIRNILSEIDGNDAMDELNSSGVLKLNLSDTTAELTKEDLLIEMVQKEGFASASDHGITVVLDTNLSPELIEEGYMREIVSKIQTMRKDSKFEVMDNITVFISGNEMIEEIIKKNIETLKVEVLAKDVVFGQNTDNSKEWDLNGQTTKIGVKKV